MDMETYVSSLDLHNIASFSDVSFIKNMVGTAIHKFGYSLNFADLTGRKISSWWKAEYYEHSLQALVIRPSTRLRLHALGK